jgi:cbb3-type cytochrome oxidase subunit 3
VFRWFFQDNEYLVWPLAGLVIFVIAFLAVLFHVFVRLRKSDEVERMAALPLDDDADAGPPPAEEGVQE